MSEFYNLWNTLIKIKVVKTILVSVNVQILEDLDAEEFRLLAKSAGAEYIRAFKRTTD
jgi:hypothetical protein